jgi:NitT/TauT family transport system substrate-binding protein
MTLLPMNRRQLLVAGCCAASTMPLQLHAQPAPSGRKVDIVMTQGLSGLVIHEVAKDQGFFESLNIEPNLLLVSDGAKCVAALISGASKICMWSGFNQLTPAIEKGAKLKILAGALNLPSLVFYSAKKDVRRVADLKGKSIGIGALGSVLHQMTVLLLQRKGVDPSTVTFRNVGSNADILLAVASGNVDAGLSDVEVFDQQEKFKIHDLEDGKLWLEISEYTNQASYATDTAIRDDRQDLVRVLAAYGKAYRFVSGPGSREAFIKGRQKVTGSSDPQQAITQWTWIQRYQPYALNLVLTEAQVNFVQQLNVDNKVQKTVMPFASIADMSLAQDALRLMA